MTAKVIDFKEAKNKVIEKQLETEAEILFDGDGVMDGMDFMSAMRGVGLRVMVVLDDDKKDEEYDE
ncbi:MAG: hypothetical protein VXY59_01065 [Pseudomonadota bacterium]|nr:hypothetical protein [Pseudomonadota bacterium]